MRSAPIPTTQQIIQATARQFGITPYELITGERRHRERHIVRFLARELTLYPVASIAAETGGVTRQAVIYATRQIKQKLQRDCELQRCVTAIRQELVGSAEGVE